MDAEKSSNSSFEDLTSEGAAAAAVAANAAANDNKKEKVDDIVDLIGNGQITKKTIKEGYSEIQPKPRDFVKLSISATLSDGKIVESESELEIQVGDFEVVQGLDMAVPLLTVGEVAEICLDSRFAYGTLGLKNEKDPDKSIPPNAEIKYIVELLECEPEDEEKLNNFADRKRLGNRKRERANFWYNRNEYNIAIQLYRRALEYLDDNEDGKELSNKHLQQLLEDRLIVYNNLAMAQIKISAFDAALMSVENVLRCQPNNSKALFRKGRILDAKGDTKGAIALLKRAAILEPESKSIQQDLAKLIIKNRREERNEKEMYQKMLGQANRLDEVKVDKKQTQDVSKLRLLGYFIGSVLIGVAGVAIYRYKY